VKFFIPQPYADTQKQARHARLCMRNFARKSTGLDTTDRKIYRIEYIHDGNHHDVRVGKPEYDSGETVLAILEANDEYLICTPTQGGCRGKPIAMAKENTGAVQDFEGQTARITARVRGAIVTATAKRGPQEPGDAIKTPG